MNAIQFYYAICVYANITQRSRFYFQEINKAVNDAIMNKLDSILDTDKNKGALNGLDRVQKFRDELYTLIKPSTLTITNVGAYNEFVNVKHAVYPTDYQTFASLTLTIDGNTTYGRNDMSYNTRGPQLDCSFRKPTNKKPFFLEDATGIKIYLGDGTISSAILEYIKIPATFYMGNESDLIDSGAGVLTPTTDYIAVEESVYNGITYVPGQPFTTGASTALTSGQVILASVTTTCDLPQKSHDELAKQAAVILLGVTSAFENSAFTEKEAG